MSANQFEVLEYGFGMADLLAKWGRFDLHLLLFTERDATKRIISGYIGKNDVMKRPRYHRKLDAMPHGVLIEDHYVGIEIQKNENVDYSTAAFFTSVMFEILRNDAKLKGITIAHKSFWRKVDEVALDRDMMNHSFSEFKLIDNDIHIEHTVGRRQKFIAELVVPKIRTDIQDIYEQRYRGVLPKFSVKGERHMWYTFSTEDFDFIISVKKEGAP